MIVLPQYVNCWLVARIKRFSALRLEWLMHRESSWRALLVAGVVALAAGRAPLACAAAAADGSSPASARVASLSLRVQKRELDIGERLLRKKFETLPAGSQASLERDPQQLVVRIPTHELFEDDSAQLKAHAIDALPWAAVTELLRRRHRLVAQINVYSDSIGGVIANHGLSELRALTLLTALHVASIPAGRVASSGEGATSAVASDDTPEGRDQNRRVEVVFGFERAAR
jgi:outer membrane protein OmpA-like peptidoglycan-associated protein